MENEIYVLMVMVLLLQSEIYDRGAKENESYAWLENDEVRLVVSLLSRNQEILNQEWQEISNQEQHEEGVQMVMIVVD